MHVVRGIRRLFVGIVLVLVVFVYVTNTSRFSAPRAGSATVLVHRGVKQRYGIAEVGFDTCTAAHMFPPEHEYLENTIASMRAAFDRGADLVEFDIHPTTDNRFAVFHDRNLECRTDGQGLTRSHTLRELKALDIGYGYTFDGGRTYPFRGRGVGLMPTIDEVLETFPGRSLLIDVKDNEPADRILLADYLAALSTEQRSKLIVYARDGTLVVLRERFPGLRMFSTISVTSCLLRYIAYGWTGIVPAPCHDSPIFVPINVAPWLWGWPRLFMRRMEVAGGSTILMGRFPATEVSPGLDTPEDFARVPADFDGGIWTNNVDLINLALKRDRGQPAVVSGNQRPPVSH
jgi:glycerophosphoryl diester phosphodiesterase